LGGPRIPLHLCYHMVPIPTPAPSPFGLPALRLHLERCLCVLPPPLTLHPFSPPGRPHRPCRLDRSRLVCTVFHTPIPLNFDRRPFFPVFCVRRTSIDPGCLDGFFFPATWCVVSQRLFFATILTGALGPTPLVLPPSLKPFRHGGPGSPFPQVCTPVAISAPITVEPVLPPATS